MTRNIETHNTNDRQPTLTAKGNIGPGGAEQSYEICYAGPDGMDRVVGLDFMSLEHNGVTNEVLLAVVIDRLEGFQSGNFACIENELALHNCKNALGHLLYRTRQRQRRGVEGTDKE